MTHSGMLVLLLECVMEEKNWQVGVDFRILKFWRMWVVKVTDTKKLALDWKKWKTAISNQKYI